MNKEKFSQAFEDEHRRIMDTVETLTARLRDGNYSDIAEEVEELNELLGPHFRYEEEALYPSLKDQYGRVYVKRLYDSHEGTIHTIRKLMRMVDNSNINRTQALELVHGWVMPHVSDCEGLSIMVGQIPEEDLDRITEVRDEAWDEGLDLLTWADKHRSDPDFGTLSIYNSQ